MTATQLQDLLILAVLAGLAIVGTVVAFRRPWWSVVATLVSLPFVPFWLGASVSVFFVPIHVALATLSLVAVLRIRREPLTLGLVDWILLALFGLSVVAFVTNQINLAHTYSLAQWLIFYAFARVASAHYGLRRVVTVFTIAATAAAAFLMFEAATGINVWLRYFGSSNALFTQWGTIQSRGGVVRAEGAFGHSIAAGVSLAVAAILALGSTLRESRRLLVVALLFSATLVTISRLGMVTAAIGIGLAVIVGQVDLSRRSRGLILGVLGLGGLAYVIVLSGVFEESGGEAANSAAYRIRLINLIPSANPIGMGESFALSTAGRSSFGAFRSIDSALLLFTLTQGWIAALVVIMLLLAAVVRVLQLRAGPAVIAVVAQIPAILTVALITQYALVLWLAVGLAVTEALARSPDGPSPSPASHPPAEFQTRRPARQE